MLYDGSNQEKRTLKEVNYKWLIIEVEELTKNSKEKLVI